MSSQYRYVRKRVRFELCEPGVVRWYVWRWWFPFWVPEGTKTRNSYLAAFVAAAHSVKVFENDR